MAKRARHENIYILISLIVYAAIVTAYFLLPWSRYVKLPILLVIAAVYELALRRIVKRFK
ncbi:hypothetical protein FACS1894211_08900 [Clostridia bacterium]|nr:hypothetical protein FACS1894211_08900 [Clostridia bacterium]